MTVWAAYACLPIQLHMLHDTPQQIPKVSLHPQARAELQVVHLHACCYCTPCTRCLIAAHNNGDGAMIPDTLSGFVATGSMMVTAVKHPVQAAAAAAASMPEVTTLVTCCAELQQADQP